MLSVQPGFEVVLLPGQLFVADARYRLRTLLGSCVSITLWHPATRRGAMSHFVLPTRGGPPPGAALDGRYGDEALRQLLQTFARTRVQPGECQAKLFGGGNMFPGQGLAGEIAVGQRNGQAARTMLAAHGIGIVSESLFGDGHRQIVFDVGSGDVWSHQVEPAMPAPLGPGRPG